MTPKFELRSIRDFGQIISDSFTFLKDNFKPLFIPLIVICGAFTLLGTVAYSFMQMGMMNMMDIKNQPNPNVFRSGIFNDYFLGMGLYYVAVGLYYFLIFLVTFSYIAVYREKKEQEKPTLEEVWGYVKYYFLRCIGSSFLLILLTIVGFVLCVIPGIYVSTVFALAMPIMIFENTSFSFAFSKCFKLISNNWWMTFGIIFVVSLIIGFAAGIASLPITLITVLKLFLVLKSFTTPLLVFFAFLVNVMYLSYSLLAIALSLCYFSYTERQEGTGLLDRINNLGKDDDASHLPTEQY
ncbi:hypothetical protein GCM10023149_36190 [Mucilaginibacter gynuensis]|uniref:Glycerophosphoryl diester phosphodiesterase membrane domain-containing protein n=1 Tax=Mucilaginibacter gynuensis TaxID=1302236 RepID=A0ABP8GVZ8_9SPHI